MASSDLQTRFIFVTYIYIYIYISLPLVEHDTDDFWISGYQMRVAVN